jgi:hypothetical protein
MMLRMTSKRFENAMDKRDPLTVAKQSRTFLDNVVFLKRQRLLHMLTELEKMTSRWITMLDLQNRGLSGQLRMQRGCTGVLAQSHGLPQLNLSDNQIGAEGAGTAASALSSASKWQSDWNGRSRVFAGVLPPQCPALSLLPLSSFMKEEVGLTRGRRSYHAATYIPTDLPRPTYTTIETYITDILATVYAYITDILATVYARHISQTY